MVKCENIFNIVLFSYIWLMKIEDAKSALFIFEEAATKHAEATLTGDYKTANKNYALIVKSVTFLK